MSIYTIEKNNIKFIAPQASHLREMLTKLLSLLNTIIYPRSIGNLLAQVLHFKMQVTYHPGGLCRTKGSVLSKVIEKAVEFLYERASWTIILLEEEGKVRVSQC